MVVPVTETKSPSCHNVEVYKEIVKYENSAEAVTKILDLANSCTS